MNKKLSLAPLPVAIIFLLTSLTYFSIRFLIVVIAVVVYFLWPRALLNSIRLRSYFTKYHLYYHTKRNHKIYQTKMERPLPQVGELIIEDYREYKSVTDKKYIKVISYNIELGYRLNQILIDLQQLDPDILFLQEVDIYHLNNQNSVTGIDVFRDLAKHLKMNAMFVGNWRYTSKPNGQGIWGNAILTKFDWKDLMAERLPKVNQVNQHVLCATIQTPIGDIRCFNTHLEVCSGILQRQLQFRHILKLTEQCQLPMLIAGKINFEIE